MAYPQAAATIVDHFRERKRDVLVLQAPPLDLFPGPEGVEGIESLMREVAEVLEMELALLGHINADRYTTVAVYARSPPAPIAKGDILPIGDTYCRQEITSGEPFVLGDASLEPRFREHPGYTKYGLRAYVGVPVSLQDGTLFGTICGVDTRARHPSLKGVERVVAIAEELGEEISRRLLGELPAGPAFPPEEEPAA